MSGGDASDGFHFSVRPAEVCQRPLVLGERELRIEEIVDVARGRRRVELAEGCRERVGRCRAMVDFLVEQEEKVYGLTTGFGILRDTTIPARDTQILQDNLIRSHAAGVGEPFSEEVVRAAILLRANTLCRGNSGVRVEIVEQLLHLLNEDIFPFVPQQGSVGASGDLAPLSHLALVLMGDPEGRIYAPGGELRLAGQDSPVVERCTADDFVRLAVLGFDEELDDAALAEGARQAGWELFQPMRLQSKEGLALNNGTQFMTAVAALLVWDSWFTLRVSELAAALSLECNRGVRGAFDRRVHAVRPQRHQQAVAQRIIGLCADSQILDLYLNSAHLGRARQRLEAARSRLDQLRRELQEQDEEIPFAVGALARLIDELECELQELIPTIPDGGRDVADPQRIRDWSQPSPAEQIAAFDRLLRRQRQRASELVRAVNQATFPAAPATPLLEAELVEVQRELRRAVPGAPLVQDDYSFRCMPQVLACAWRALEHVHEIVCCEANAATDNPLLFPPRPPGCSEAELAAMSAAEYARWLESEPEAAIRACREAVIGGGNFHGEPIAVAMDYLGICLAEAGNIAERRISHLVDAHQSRGLPPFLIQSSGLNSGFMIPQYTAAALVSENKVLSHPASTDSIPTCAGSEDHVSMGTIAARQAAEVHRNVREVVAIELLVGFQAIEFRAPLQPGEPLREALALFRARGMQRFTTDRVMYPAMALARSLLDDRELLCLLVGCAGDPAPGDQRTGPNR